MKTNHLLFLITLTLFISCQQEDTSTPIQQEDFTENWKKATPNEIFKNPENGFSISKKAIREAMELPNVTNIRFVLEVHNENLQIRVVGADQNGNTTKGVLATPISLQKEVTKLFEEKTIQYETATLSKSVASHILQPEDAKTFISRWQKQFKNKALEDVVAYDDVRIEYFSMPAAIGQQMLQSNSENINLVWGVNAKGKFTTVFLPELDENQKLLKKESPMYEYSKPCPPTCAD